MKITKVEAIPVTLPASGGLTSRGTWTPVYTPIRITTDVGIVGIGDAGFAHPVHYGETQGTVMEIVQNVIAPQLLGEDPLNISKIIHKIEHTVCWNWIAKSGVDYALHDIAGKALGVPVYTLLGGRFREKVPLSPYLGAVEGLEDIETHIKVALDLVKAGFKGLTFKVGLGDPATDVEYVRLVREAVGPDILLVADANQAWDPVTAIKTIRKFEKYDLFAMESPVPEWDIAGLAKVHHSVDIPIIADEVARSTEGAINIIREDAADMFKLHVSKAGGLFKSREYAAIAEAANMPVFVGIMFRSSLEHASNAQFAVAIESVGNIPAHTCDGPGGRLPALDILATEREHPDIIKGFPKIENGCLYPSDAPGLGVELDEEKLRKYLTPGKQIAVCEKK